MFSPLFLFININLSSAIFAYVLHIILHTIRPTQIHTIFSVHILLPLISRLLNHKYLAKAPSLLDYVLYFAKLFRPRLPLPFILLNQMTRNTATFHTLDVCASRVRLCAHLLLHCEGPIRILKMQLKLKF